MSAPPSDPRGRTSTFEGMIGASDVMQDLFALILRVAPRADTVLVLGETGTGKELVARALHARSQRSRGPFVPVDCSAIQDTLIESELFGHERGAFTGAYQALPGKFEQAAGGTLLLDEVGNLSAPAQAKLLRALETHEITRVGGLHSRRVDVRIIAATNADLTSAVEHGAFRQDLHARLRRVEIRLPPLRVRGADLDLLLDATLDRMAPSFGRPGIQLTPDARACVHTYSWPNNVRDVERIVIHALLRNPPTIGLADLPPDVLEPRPPLPPVTFVVRPGETIDQSVRRLKLMLSREMMRQHGNNVAGAARAMGIDRGTLSRILRDDVGP